MSSIEIRHFRYFIMVAQEGSFSKAAQKLKIAQPSLSKQIKELENHLKQQLFIRNYHNVTLTDQGTLFLKEATEIINHFNSAISLNNKDKQNLFGLLSIGVISNILDHNFAEILSLFKEKYKRINLSIHNHSTNTQISNLLNGTINIGFVTRSRELLPETFIHRIFKKENFKIAISKQNELAQKQKITWHDLKSQEFIYYPNRHGNKIYKEFHELCKKEGFTPNITQYANNLETQIWMVSCNFGVTLVPSLGDNKKYDTIKFFDLPSGSLECKTFVVWRNNDPSILLHEFLEFMKDHWSKFDTNS